MGNVVEFVYFVQRGENGPIKIGRSNNIKRRLSEFQVSNAEPMNILLALKGGRDLERAFHIKYDPYRQSGEWFAPVSHLLDEIRALGAAGLDARTQPGHRSKKPRYMRQRTIAQGMLAWYWQAPPWAYPPAERGGKMVPRTSAALGNDYTEAVAKADLYNREFDEWRRLGRQFHWKNAG